MLRAMLPARSWFCALAMILAWPSLASAQPPPVAAQPPPATATPPASPTSAAASTPAPGAADAGTGAATGTEPGPEPSPPSESPESPPPAPVTPSPEPGHTAASVAQAPSPGVVTGVSQVEPDSDTGRAIGRVALYPVRGLLWVVDAPLRGGAWLYERYQVRDRWKSVFFNDTGTIGLYPSVLFETGFGLNAGARFIHRDLFGGKESLKARASFGGRFQQLYSLKLDSGDRLGDRAALQLEGEFEARPRDRFFGIGNGDEVEAESVPPMAMIDPFADPTAVATRFRQLIARVDLLADVDLVGPLSARATSAILWKRFDSLDEDGLDPDPDDIANVYDTAALPAFEEGTDYLYNELELRFDTRHRDNRWEPETLPSEGVLLSGFAGLTTAVARSDADYVRYGADLQLYVRLGPSPRVLIVRGLVEEVKGSSDQIPFSDLPRLGGPDFLRGYDQDRFRDRAFALTSAEYMFDLTNMLAAFAFTDVGRVYPALSDLEAEDLRVGFGGGFQFQTDHSYLGRASIASSIDGDLFLHFSFDPVYDPKTRVERK